MSRVIKFRVWDGTKYLPKANMPWLAHDGQAWSASSCHWGQDEEPWEGLTVEQFTGLVDSKGQDIYEGDVVHTRFEDDLFAATIRWGSVGWEIDIHDKELYESGTHGPNGDGTTWCSPRWHSTIALYDNSPHSVSFRRHFNMTITVIGHIHEPDFAHLTT